jgi:hypothetical protein
LSGMSAGFDVIAAIQIPSFRGDAKHRTRNLEIPGLALTRHPEMTASGSSRSLSSGARSRDRLILNYDNELRIFQRSPAGSKTKLNASICCPGNLRVAAPPAQHLRDAWLSAKESLMTLHADFASQDYFRDPAAAIGKLRTLGPVVQVRFPIVGKVWTTTTQALADQVLKDTETFTIRREDGTVAGLQWWMPGIVRTFANSMLSMDEPDHKRLRDIVDEAFRRRAVLDMEPHIQATGDQLADELFAEGSPADLVERYARKLPLSVISELLGLPLADRPKFTAWAAGFTRFTGTLGFLSMIPNVFAMKRYIEQHLETVRRQGG